MQASDNAYLIIKHFEGLKVRSYKDMAGIWTIGYGHTSRVGPKMLIDEDEANEFLIDDVDESEYELNRLLKVSVSQQQYDALISWIFNLGASKVAKSTLLKKINEGLGGVSKEFVRWNKVRDPRTGLLKPAAGLTRRRMCEAHLYDTGELLFEFPDHNF